MTIRGALNRLEADQKRRSRRIQTDTLDRFLIDLTTFYRDVLSVQLGTGMPLVNEHLGEQIRGYATNSSAEQTLEKIDVISETRQRIRTNVSAQLAFEAMMVPVAPARQLRGSGTAQKSQSSSSVFTALPIT